MYFITLYSFLMPSSSQFRMLVARYNLVSTAGLALFARYCTVKSLPPHRTELLPLSHRKSPSHWASTIPRTTWETRLQNPSWSLPLPTLQTCRTPCLRSSTPVPQRTWFPRNALSAPWLAPLCALPYSTSRTVLTWYGGSGKSKIPVGETLFFEKEGAILCVEDVRKRFYSTLPKLLYLANRVLRLLPFVA